MLQLASVSDEYECLGCHSIAMMLTYVGTMPQIVWGAILRFLHHGPEAGHGGHTSARSCFIEVQAVAVSNKPGLATGHLSPPMAGHTSPRSVRERCTAGGARFTAISHSPPVCLYGPRCYRSLANDRSL